MAWTVNIPFRKRLEVGETTFKVNVPRRFLDNSQRTFGFQSISLLPEYQSQQAFVYNLDPTSELAMEVKNDFYLEVKYGATFFSNAAWSYAPALTTMDALLKQLNQHFDANKPPGTLFPPVVFDWISMYGLQESDAKKFHQETAAEYYGEEYDDAKHGHALPPTLASFTHLNPLVFPTLNNPDMLDAIRIRMTLAPNVTVTFSNEVLPKVLGFSADQIPARNSKNQVAFVNTSGTDFESLFCTDPCVLPLKVSELKGLKMNVYITKPFVYSPMGVFKTTKGRERSLELMADDYQVNLSRMSRELNLYMSLTYTKNERRFKIIYPNNTNVSIDIKTKPYVCRQLGFEPLDVIKYKAVSTPIPANVDVKELEQKARALVYDTGMVVVDLNQQSSFQNSYSGTATMAVLEPTYDGVMRCSPHVEMPRVNVTYFDPQLEFILYRIGDDDLPHPLEWNVGAFVQGLLVGKV